MNWEVSIKLEEENLCVNWLAYKSYEFQRDNAPSVSPIRWRKVYIFQQDYEKVYQAFRAGNSVHMELDSVHKEMTPYI